jgi:hypothetical protein
VKRTPDHTLTAVLHRHLLVVKLGELLEKLRRLDVVQSPAKRKTVSLFSMFVPPFVPSLSGKTDRLRRQKRRFCAILYSKRSFHQDRLGANTGKALKKREAFFAPVLANPRLFLHLIRVIQPPGA